MPHELIFARGSLADRRRQQLEASVNRIFPQTLVCILLCLATTKAQDRVSYRVEYSTQTTGRLHVVIMPPKPSAISLVLIIPRAIPSGYGQQFYDRYIENVKATSATNERLRVEREDGPRWRIATGAVKVEYDVDLVRHEREITSVADASKARPDYVGLLGYSVLGFLEGTENSPVRLEIAGPNDWPIFTTLGPKAPLDRTKTTAEAKNFFGLADSQIAMGPALQIRRLEGPLPLYLISYAETETDLNKHGEIIADAFRKTLDYFGDAPFENYTAYIEFLKPVSNQHEYGFSMEHLNSSTYFLGVDRAVTSKTPTQDLERDRYNFVHHISHSWIPKQVYGTGYLPFTWELAPQIETIWFNEGFARFVAIEALTDPMPANEGRDSRRRRFEAFRQTLANTPAFIRNMPVLELSRVGSVMYSSDFRVGRTLFCKGALMAEEMDQKIRARTNGKKRLRDSLLSLVKWGLGSGRAFRTQELPGLIAKPVGVSEQEIREIMERWLH